MLCKYCIEIKDNQAKKFGREVVAALEATSTSMILQRNGHFRPCSLPFSVFLLFPLLRHTTLLITQMGHQSSKHLRLRPASSKTIVWDIHYLDSIYGFLRYALMLTENEFTRPLLYDLSSKRFLYPWILDYLALTFHLSTFPLAAEPLLVKLRYMIDEVNGTGETFCSNNNGRII